MTFWQVFSPIRIGMVATELPPGSRSSGGSAPRRPRSVVVIGAEETNINLSNIPLSKVLKGTIIPLPLNVIPLPAKWKIIFLPPISMKKYSKRDCANSELVHSISESVKAQIQGRINEELSRREWIYFPTPKV